MYQSTYFVDKTTDTFADVLLAYGVAALLERLAQANIGGTTIRVQDAGSVYAITLKDPIKEGFEEIDWFCDLPFIQTRSKKPPQDWAGPAVDYEAERARRGEYFEAHKKLSKEAKRPGATVDEFPELRAVNALAPRPDWDILAQINQMGAISAYSKVLATWHECRVCFPDLLRLLLALFAATPNDFDEAMCRQGGRQDQDDFHQDGKPAEECQGKPKEENAEPPDENHCQGSQWFERSANEVRINLACPTPEC